VTLDDTRYRRALIALICLGAVLRLIGLDWDDGRGLHPDEGNLIRGALTLGVNGRMLPEFHAYNDLALWLPRLLSLPLCTPEDGACLTLIARGLSAVMSVALIPLGAGLARALAGGSDGARLAGLATALVLALSGALIQWAHFGTTESAIALNVVLLWWLAMRWQTGRLSDVDFALWSAAALGIGFGFKTTAAVVSVIPLAAFALAGRPDAARAKLFALFAGVATIQALIFAPSVVFDTQGWLDVMAFENGVVTGSVPVFWTAQFEGARNVLFEVAQLWSLTVGAGLVLALLGLALAARHHWRIALPGLVFLVVYATLTFGWHAKFVRYLAPVLPVLLIFAGVATGRLLVQRRSQTARMASAAALGLMVLAGVDSASAYLRADPRIAMEDLLDTRAAPGDLVAIEPRDLPQTGAHQTITLPLNRADVSPADLAGPLARAEWLIIASRRNWQVLPRQPGASTVLCAYYAGLADRSLGYVAVARTDRLGLFGRLFHAGLAAEETRHVFDRPEVFLLRNIAHFTADDLAQRLSAPEHDTDCTPTTLQTSWRSGP